MPLISTLSTVNRDKPRTSESRCTLTCRPLTVSLRTVLRLNPPLIVAISLSPNSPLPVLASPLIVIADLVST